MNINSEMCIKILLMTCMAAYLYPPVYWIVMKILNYHFSRRDQTEIKERRSRENKEPITISYNMLFRVVMIICFFVFAGCVVLTYGNLYLGWNNVISAKPSVLIGLLAFSLFGWYGIAGTCFWKVTLQEDRIDYRDYFGVHHRYTFEDLDLVEQRINWRGAPVYAWCKGHKAFVIDDNLKNGSYFMDEADRYCRNVHHLSANQNHRDIL